MFAAPLPAARAAPATRRSVSCKAAGQINPTIKKEEPKVVDTVDASKIEKQAVYCRCWRSDTFPLCNGAHMAHNKETGDNVGPLIVKKE